MMSQSPYGGEKISYPSRISQISSPTDNAVEDKFGLTDGYIVLKGDNSVQCYDKDIGEKNRVSYLTGNPTSTPAGHAFVLTVVYRHEFSSSMVKTLFAGGSNTAREDFYILWSRGSGIVDKREES